MIESTVMTRPQASPKVQIDNNRFKVTEWCFPPGGETGWHLHATDNTKNSKQTFRLAVARKQRPWFEGLWANAGESVKMVPAIKNL
jgi:hypothetical protein